MKTKNITRPKQKVIYTDPKNLRFKAEGRSIMLQIMDKSIEEYPLDKSSIEEWLCKFKFPVFLLDILSHESIVSICNDYLLTQKVTNIEVPVVESNLSIN